VTEPSSNSVAATEPATVYEQPVVAWLRLTIFHSERFVPGVGPGWGGQDVPATWGEVVVVAVRRPDCPTNEDAVRATVELLALFGCLPAATSPAYLLAQMVSDGNDTAHEHQIADMSMRLANDAVQGQPDAATASALEAYLPFTVGLHPDPKRGVFLDDQQQKFFSSDAALLMLAWLIAARR